MKNTNQLFQKFIGTCAAFLLGMLTTVHTHAANPDLAPQTATDDSTADQMTRLRKQVDDAEAAYTKAGGKPDADVEKLWKTYCGINQTNLPRIFELARRDPQTEASFEMFKWIVINRQIQVRSLNTNGVQSLEYLREYDTAKPGVAQICRALRRNWNYTCQPAVDFLRAVADKNPDRDARGQALLSLAQFKDWEAENLEFWQNAPPMDARFEKARSDGLAKEKNETSAGLFRDAEKLFHTVLDQYADCPSLAPATTEHVKATLGEIAKADLYEIEHLSVGNVAPDITGKDIDGKKLRLRDFRGGVVMLSFWASWCGPCMQMVPSEVRLSERMKGKSFAMIGVNGDSRLDDAKKAMERNAMTWPSFYTGDGPYGPISEAWNISGWPTAYILDRKGVIRFKLEGYGRDTEKLLDGKAEQVLNASVVQSER
jgi:thiol-disulfide isomerase/thioredoxin